ncbi:MAG: hypothetical protein WD023_04850 [Ilumatobacteraceae bacterium]
MVVHDPAAALLRTRARNLRRLGTALLETQAARLHRRSGPEVWSGPAAATCLDELQLLGRRLADARDDLERRAIRLDEQAARLDAIARMA